MGPLAGGSVEIVGQEAARIDAQAAGLAAGRILVRVYLPADTAPLPDAASLGLDAVPGAVLIGVEPLDDDWQERWKTFFRPTRAGHRFIIRPPWEEPTDRRPGDLEVQIDPGMAFGTGAHETTRLCLAAMERAVVEGHAVLDVGCGSGVLSVGAVLLGAERVEGTDIDEDAIRATVENAARNHVAGRIRARRIPLDRVTGQFDVVVANILSSVLVALRDDLAVRVRPGGRLILSGILSTEADDVAAAFEGGTLVGLGCHTEGEWACLELQRSL